MTKFLFPALALVVALAGVSLPAVAEEVVLISTHTRDFIGADAAANGVLKTVPGEAQALVIDRIALDGNKMAFRARNGMFVRAGISAKTLLGAVSEHIRGWETFEIVKITAAKFAIKSVQNGLYVTLGADGRLSATSNNVGSRETFSTRAAQVADVQPQRPIIRLPRPQADDLDLAGRWSIHRVRTFDGSLTAVPPALRDDSFVRIRNNGQMSASTGCNEISGRVRHEGDLVQFGEVMSTKTLCLGDPGLYELLLLVAFDHGRTVSDQGNQLRFFDVNGDAVLVLRRN